MTIGSSYHAKAMASIIGPAHSALIPDTMWGAWLDGAGDVIEMTGTQVAHTAFAEITGGVANSVIVEAGVLPAGTVAFFALMDAATSGQIIAMATFTTDAVENDAVVFPAGTLQFLYGSPS